MHRDLRTPRHQTGGQSTHMTTDSPGTRRENEVHSATGEARRLNHGVPTGAALGWQDRQQPKRWQRISAP
jgi:hypothetical protein